jgi:hypothetical protein
MKACTRTYKADRSRQKTVAVLYSGNYCVTDRTSQSEAKKLVNTYPIAAGTDEATNKKMKKVQYLRRGDVISYEGHVSLVYSNKWGEHTWQTGGIWSSKKSDWATRKLNYDIIHAFGTPLYKYDGEEKFSRKVTVTGDYTGSDPTGIGRIKLWN